jgi:hypothetical protein
MWPDPNEHGDTGERHCSATKQSNPIAGYSHAAH